MKTAVATTKIRLLQTTYLPIHSRIPRCLENTNFKCDSQPIQRQTPNLTKNPCALLLLLKKILLTFHGNNLITFSLHLHSSFENWRKGPQIRVTVVTEERREKKNKKLKKRTQLPKKKKEDDVKRDVDVFCDHLIFPFLVSQQFRTWNTNL